MKPEGPNNAPLVALKCMVFCSVIGGVGLYPLSGHVSSVWRIPPQMALAMLGCGLSVLYIVVAVFAGYQARLMSAEVQMTDRNQFASQVTNALVKSRYQPAFQEGNMLTFKAQFPMSAIYDAVAIELKEGTARIVGPRSFVQHLLNTVADADPVQPEIQN